MGQVVPGGIPCPTTSNATLYAVLVAFSAIQSKGNRKQAL